MNATQQSTHTVPAFLATAASCQAAAPLSVSPHGASEGSRARPSGRDRQAFTTAVAALRPVLVNRARALHRNPSDADDLVQDTMVRAIVNWRLFRSGTSLQAWTTSIMRNLFVDGQRKRKVCVPLDPEAVAAPQHDDRPTLGPLDTLGTAEIDAAIAILPRRDQELFASYFHRVRYRDLAAHLRLNPSTVGTRLFRARVRMRSTLEEAHARRLVEAGLT